jgi:hypothetical protein
MAWSMNIANGYTVRSKDEVPPPRPRERQLRREDK